MSKFTFPLLSLFLLISVVSFGQTNQKRNCGTMNHLSDQLRKDPGLADRMNQIEQQTARFVNSRVSGTSTIVIPVVFHIVYKTSAQNISDALCIAQLNQLNLDFAKLNNDTGNIPSVFKSLATNTNIQFCLAQRDPNGLATTGIIRKSTSITSFSTDDKVKSSTTGGDNAWSSSSYLNIWVCNLGGGVLGYAQFPGGATSTDGVVLLYSTIGSMSTPGTASPYNLGRTATHEVGHWLNLRHIWGDASCGSDLVGDTPTQQTSNFGCPSFPHVTCSNGSNGDMFMNYMDYVDDGCMNMFTVGQTTRMTALFVSGGSRASLSSSTGCQPVSSICGTPVGLNASSITSISATLGWNAVSGALSYNVQYRGVGDSTWISLSSNSNNISVSNLTAAKNYEFQVRTVCTSGNTAYSASATFTTLAPVSSCINAYEANETLGAAASISNNVNISSGIGSTTDIDYFKFTTAATSNLNITLTTLPADFDIVLYNSASTQIGSSSAASTSNESIVLSNQAAGTYYIKVFGYNSAFNSSNCYTLYAGVTSNSLSVPAAPTSISITPISTSTCGAKKYRYTAPVLPSATSTNAAATGYVWSFTGTLGANATIDSGTINSRIIIASFTSNAAAATGDSVKLFYTSSSGNSLPIASKLTNTVLLVPAAPTSINITTITTNICNAKKYRYRAPALTNATATTSAATGYSWSFTGTLGANATIDSGNVNSQVITVTYTSNLAANTGDSVRVLFTSACGNSANKSVKLTNALLSIPVAPTSIIITPITTNICNAKKYRYSAPALSAATTTATAATGYLWSFKGTLGANATIDSGNVNSQVITVTYTSNVAAKTGDSVRVLFTSACGNSANKSLKLTNTLLTPPAAPSGITVTALTTNVCNAKRYRYSAPALTAATTTAMAATGYLWSFTGNLGANASIDSGTVTSRVITVKYTSNVAAVTGDSVKVLFTSKCGNSANKSLKLTNTNLVLTTAPASITIALVKDSCGNRVYRYTAPTLPAATATLPAAAGYIWSFVGSLYSTATIDSGSINSRIIKIKYSNNNGATTGDSAKVAFTSLCGNSPFKSVKLTNVGKSCRLASPRTYTGNGVSAEKTTSLISKVTIYPNPSSNDFNINLPYLNEEKIIIKVYDIQHRMIKNFRGISNQSIKMGSDLKPGIYVVEIISGYSSTKTRIIKQ